MDINKLCMGCMRESDGDEVFCRFCGYKLGSSNSSRGLQPQTILYGKYLVGKVIGEGGFGITYIAYDLFLNNRVAIKEYFPSELVTRDTSSGMQTSLSVLTGSKEEEYKKGIERFVKEAANLAKFNNLEGIVSVKEFFYENNTAYMVMEYIDGITLSKYLNDNGGKLSYKKVLELMSPVMDSLQKVHEAGIVHRDISPDNIMITSEGKLKLIDFGAARAVGNEDVKSMTVILKHGYAPEEQYQPDGKLGSWTDVYALSATMYRMMTGIVPQEATDRVLRGDKVEPIQKRVKEVPTQISDAIRHGLAVKASGRAKTVSEFRKELENSTWITKRIKVVGIIAAVLMIGIVGICVAIKNKPAIELKYVADAGINEEEIAKESEESMAEESDEIDETFQTEEMSDEREEELSETVEESCGYVIDYAVAYESEEMADGDKNEIIPIFSKVNVVNRDLEGCIEIEYEGKNVFLQEDCFVYESEYVKWKEMFDEIVASEKINVEQGAFEIEYDDFDGDGIKEIFMAVFSRKNNGSFDFINAGLYYGKDGSVSFLEDFYESYALTYEEVDISAMDVMAKYVMGPQKLLCISYCTLADRYYADQYYSVENDEPHILDIERLSSEHGWIAEEVDYYKMRVYTPMNQPFYLESPKYEVITYPIFYLNGELGECASCEIDVEEFMKLQGAQEILEKSSSFFEGNDTLYLAAYTYFDILNCQASLDSVLFNEMGFFALNYTIDADWSLTYGSIASDVATINSPSFLTHIYYEGTKDARYYSDVMEIDKLSGYVLVSYLSGELEIVESGYGYYQESSGERNVVITSDFHNFQGL